MYFRLVRDYYGLPSLVLNKNSTYDRKKRIIWLKSVKKIMFNCYANKIIIVFIRIYSCIIHKVTKLRSKMEVLWIVYMNLSLHICKKGGEVVGTQYERIKAIGHIADPIISYTVVHKINHTLSEKKRRQCFYSCPLSWNKMWRCSNLPEIQIHFVVHLIPSCSTSLSQ